MSAAPPVEQFAGEDISQALAKSFLMDKELVLMPEKGKDGPVNKTIFALGRFARYLAHLIGTEEALDTTTLKEPFANVIYRTVSGEEKVNPKRARMVEAMVTACVDHGVTPPSAQATKHHRRWWSPRRPYVRRPDGRG